VNLDRNGCVRPLRSRFTCLAWSTPSGGVPCRASVRQGSAWRTTAGRWWQQTAICT